MLSTTERCEIVTLFFGVGVFILISSSLEGFAVGILLGALSEPYAREEFAVIIPVIIAMGLHNIPEGAVVSMSFKKEGASRVKSFFLGQVAGFAEFLAGIGGFLVVTGFENLLPYAMSFAAGAMVWVAVNDLIPESQKNKEDHPYFATIGIIVGVALMVSLPELL